MNSNQESYEADEFQLFLNYGESWVGKCVYQVFRTTLCVDGGVMGTIHWKPGFHDTVTERSVLSALITVGIGRLLTTIKRRLLRCPDIYI